LDELGYLPCDARSGDLLYSIVSRRHEHASTVITTNLAFKDWGTVFPGAACVVALVDRFTQHCHVLDIDGDSWRQRPEPDPHSPPAPAPATKKRRAA
jgi:DNA replication protein DnaC